MDKNKYASFRKYIIAGLIAILPLWITLQVIWIIFKWIGGLTRPFLEPLFELFFGKEPASLLLTVTSFIFTIFLIYVTGYMVTNIAIRKILSKMEDLFFRMPFLKGIYTTTKEFVKFIFTTERGKKYIRVVLVKWFNSSFVKVMGFVTMEIKDPVTDRKILGVFVPTTPNPTTGFFLLLPEEEIIPVNIPIDDALKLIISGGVVSSETARNALMDKIYGRTG
ncbi:MAG: DUF502 domain-containing protein [Elusimicrobia bacterium]|nr:DUF502 domain-containing protein [Elusimicrobiota bacterium]